LINFKNYIPVPLSALNFLLVILLSLLSTGCSTDEGDDLDKFMREAANDMRARIKPLPEVKPYIALQYNADGTLSDPFRARKATGRNDVLQPNLNRPKEPTEAYPLESVKYVGSLSKKNLKFALLKTPDNNVLQVKVGNYVGQNFGMVTQITDSEVTLKEIIQDDLSGDWIERNNTLTLEE
jgi:type IV pilus assembly protein PilP